MEHVTTFALYWFPVLCDEMSKYFVRHVSDSRLKLDAEVFIYFPHFTLYLVFHTVRTMKYEAFI